MKKTLPSLIALSLFGLATTAHAARDNDRCDPETAATCYPDDCKCCYCLGPELTAVNPAVRPKTCDGDIFIEVAGFYWNSHIDGMEYAVEDSVTVIENPKTAFPIQVLNNLIDAKYKTLDFKWDFGFKAALGYNSPCDGWDIGVYWTWYKGRASSHDEAELDDNQTLITLWSAYAPLQGAITFARDITTDWSLKLNLVDVELGREFWTSKYLTLRPHVGLRFAYIDQDFEIKHKGGSFSATTATDPDQLAYNNEVDLNNKFKGIGVRAGLNTIWNFDCGWAIYGDLAASIVYGRFIIDHDETNREAETADHAKVKILDTHEHFRASRAMLDLGLGLQWATLFCDCKYGFTIKLGWEHHLFFHQNQLWRVVRIGDEFIGSGSISENANPAVFNNTGENVYHQRRGTLDTQGWTLSVRFDF